jgi:hypothetical protein
MQREGARFVTSIFTSAFSRVRRLLGKGRRIFLRSLGRVESSCALCTLEQAKIILSLIYARPFSDKASQKQVNYRARSVLLYALASAEHVRGVMPDFVHFAGANTRAASLSFTSTSVQMVIGVLLGVESKNKRIDDDANLSWARAYEELWYHILESGLSRDQLIKLMGREADSSLSELRTAIAGAKQIDECVAGGHLEDAFVLAKRYVGRGFGFAASRYSALAFVFSASVYDLDQLVSQLGGSLPPGFAPKLWSIMQDRSESVTPFTLKEVFDALKSLRAYLPSAYATIVPSPKSFDGGTVHTKTLWALFSREQLRNEHLVKQTAIVVAPSSAGSDQYTGEPCGVAKHACDTRFIRAAIGSIASNSEPKAPVLLGAARGGAAQTWARHGGERA